MDAIAGAMESANLADTIRDGLPKSMKRAPKKGGEGEEEMKTKLKAMDSADGYRDPLGNFFLGQYAAAEGVDLKMPPKGTRRMSSAPSSADQVKGVLEEHWANFTASKFFDDWAAYKMHENVCAVQDDFEEMRALGKGAFGAVYLGFKKDTGVGFALKLMKKKMIKMRKMESSVLIERDVLLKCDSRFLVNLHYAYQNPTHVCIVLTLMPGGDLSFAMKEYGKPTEDKCKYFVAAMACGLEDLHKSGYVYRDLKPANVLLGASGNVRISDMGLCADISQGGISQKAGSPGYWAPEQVKKQKYTTECDWWSLGCTIYALMTDRLIFKDEDETCDKDLSGFEWPASVGKDKDVTALSWTAECKDIIGKLCDKDMNSRIKGVDQLTKHPWFAGFDWAQLQAGTLEPPIKPDVNKLNCPSKEDIGDFGKIGEEETWDGADEAKFASWSAISPALWAREMAIGLEKSYKGGGGGGGGGGCCAIA